MKKTIILLYVLLFFKTISSQSYLKPSIGLSLKPADSDNICHIPWYLGSFYTSGLQNNDSAYNFKLYDLNGDSLVLSSALQTGKPILIVNGSYTCPVFRGKIPIINQIISTYGNQIQVCVVYTVEAHPNIDTSVYFGYVNTGSQNISANILYRQPTTYGERKQVVQDMKNNFTPINCPIYLDGTCNEWWSTYGPAPNNSYLIDTSGKVFSKHGWFHKNPDNIFCDIDSLLGINSGLCNIGGGASGTFSFHLLSNDTIFDVAGNTISLDGELRNATNNPVDLMIMKINTNLPSGWASSLCVDVCYPSNVDTAYYQLPAKDTQDFHFYFYTSNNPIDTGYARVGFRNQNNTPNSFAVNLWGITTNGTTAIDESFESALKIYPNPVTTYLKVNVTSNNYDLEIFDSNGKTILIVHNQDKINVSHLTSGSYFIKLKKENSYYIQKFIKQ